MEKPSIVLQLMRRSALSRVTAKARPAAPLVKYEVRIRYDNGDMVDGTFKRKADAIDFLRIYLPGEWRLMTDDVVPTKELVEEDNGDASESPEE